MLFKGAWLNRERLIFLATVVGLAGVGVYFVESAPGFPKPGEQRVDRKLPRQLKFADRMKIRVAIVLGPDEAANGQVTIKDLASGTQQTVDRAQAAQTVRKVLESPVGS